VYFGAELLTATTGIAVTAAAAAMTLFYAGILAGRVAGARLTRRPGRTGALLWASMAIALAGLLAVWLAGMPAGALAGLFAAGIGIANLFPLSLALTLAAAGEQTDAANGRAQLLGGLLVITAPFVLGVLADRLGLIAAFAVAPALVSACGLLLYAGLHSRHVQELP
jgi:fucose permease